VIFIEPNLVLAPRRGHNGRMEKLCIDFGSGALAHRRRFGGGRGQALPRAVGMRTGNVPQVVDATAGLGRDSFLLASLGARVTLIERSAKIHRLLSDALLSATATGGELAAITERMTLLHGDAKDILSDLTPDVVLVDPMHPLRKNSALVKQEMRLLREIVGTDPDAIDLMHAALASAQKRVVLKWPRKAPNMSQLRAPSHQILGKSTRYDVYMLG